MGNGLRPQRHHCTRPTLGHLAAPKDPLKGDRSEIRTPAAPTPRAPSGTFRHQKPPENPGHRRRGLRPATFPQRCLSHRDPKAAAHASLPLFTNSVQRTNRRREQAPSSTPGSRNFGRRLGELRPSPNDRAGIAYVGRLRDRFKPLFQVRPIDCDRAVIWVDLGPKSSPSANAGWRAHARSQATSATSSAPCLPRRPRRT